MVLPVVSTVVTGGPIVMRETLVSVLSAGAVAVEQPMRTAAATADQTRASIRLMERDPGKGRAARSVIPRSASAELLPFAFRLSGSVAGSEATPFNGNDAWHGRTQRKHSPAAPTRFAALRYPSCLLRNATRTREDTCGYSGSCWSPPASLCWPTAASATPRAD